MTSFRILRPSQAKKKALKKVAEWKLRKQREELERRNRLKKLGTSESRLGEALTKAAEKKDAEKVKMFLEDGANVNSRDSSGNTPLMHAVMQEDRESAKLLVDAGADVNLNNQAGVTPLIFAVDKGNTELIQFLIEKGAELEKKDAQGRTALMYACGKGNWEAVDILLEEGADINATDGKHRTALMYAAMHGKKNVVIKLVEEFGLDAKITDYKGRSASKMAYDNGHIEIARFIQKYEKRNPKDAFQARVRKKAWEKMKNEIQNT